MLASDNATQERKQGVLRLCQGIQQASQHLQVLELIRAEKTRCAWNLARSCVQSLESRGRACWQSALRPLLQIPRMATPHVPGIPVEYSERHTCALSAGCYGCPMLHCSCSMSRHLQIIVPSLSTSFGVTHAK